MQILFPCWAWPRDWRVCISNKLPGEWHTYSCWRHPHSEEHTLRNKGEGVQRAASWPWMRHLTWESPFPPVRKGEMMALMSQHREDYSRSSVEGISHGAWYVVRAVRQHQTDWQKRSCSWSQSWEERPCAFWTRSWAGLWVWLSLLLLFPHPTPRVSPVLKIAAALSSALFMRLVQKVLAHTYTEEPLKFPLTLVLLHLLSDHAVICFRSAIPKLLSCCFIPTTEKPVMSPAWWVSQVGTFFSFAGGTPSPTQARPSGSSELPRSC